MVDMFQEIRILYMNPGVEYLDQFWYKNNKLEEHYDLVLLEF